MQRCSGLRSPAFAVAFTVADLEGRDERRPDSVRLCHVQEASAMSYSLVEASSSSSIGWWV
ncbi:hypothetical protein [Natronobacterium lacisalsi]|uniref:hypothetical protein n=1 Tax=Natronobacterium lacisalsi TaxID=229731 RepID=UPI0002631B42|nr:hypothetical protein [Halobiforma lacisalsi]